MFGLPKHLALTAVLIVMLFQIVAVMLLPTDGFWINDDAVKTIQIKTMAESKFSSFSIPLNGKSIDPDLLNSPIHAPFTVERNGELFPVWSFFFATINALLLMLLGHAGLSIIPLLGSFLILLALIKIGELLSFTVFAQCLSVFIVGLASPVWFYSSVLWEHTIAVALVLWSLLFCIRFMMNAKIKFWIYSAFLLSLATYFREELYLWALLLVLAVIFHNRKERPIFFGGVFLLTFVVTLVPLWIYQYLTIGSPFGYHAASYDASGDGLISNFLNTRGLVLYNQLVAASPDKGWSFITAIIFIPTLVIRLFNKPLPYYFKILSLIAATALSVHYLWELHTSVSLIQYLMTSSSAFFVTAPFILIATFDEDRNVYRDFIFSLITFYIIGYSLSAPDCGSVGIHWGNRFVLISYPLYGLLAGYTISSLYKRIEKKHLRVILNFLFVLLLATSLVLQIYSLNILQKQKRFTAELDKVIRNRPEKIIISSAWWVPHFLVSSYTNKALFFVPQGNELAEFPIKLSVHGYDKFLYVTPTNDNQAPPAIDSILDTKLNFFNVKLIACEYVNQQWEVIQK